MSAVVPNMYPTPLAATHEKLAPDALDAVNRRAITAMQENLAAMQDSIVHHEYRNARMCYDLLAEDYYILGLTAPPRSFGPWWARYEPTWYNRVRYTLRLIR